MHESITVERVIAVLEDAEGTTSSPGFCHVCGAEASGVEPDAHDYPCDECGAEAVTGAQDTLAML
jgi:hypothetical protein